MASLFYISPTKEEVHKDISDMIKEVPSVFQYHTGKSISTVQTFRDVKFKQPKYVCINREEKLEIYFLEGNGGLIFSLEDITAFYNEQESGYIVEGEHVTIEPDFPCMVTFSCTSDSNTVVVVKDVRYAANVRVHAVCKT